MDESSIYNNSILLRKLLNSKIKTIISNDDGDKVDDVIIVKDNLNEYIDQIDE